MRFLTDENVSHYVVERLRAAGFDVTAIGLTNPGASDSDVMARREGRILINILPELRGPQATARAMYRRLS